MTFRYSREHRFEWVAQSPAYHPYHLERAWEPILRSWIGSHPSACAVELGPGGTRKTSAAWRDWLATGDKRLTLIDVDPIVEVIARELGSGVAASTMDFREDWQEACHPELVVCLGNTFGNLDLELLRRWTNVSETSWIVGLDLCRDPLAEYGGPDGRFAKLLREEFASANPDEDLAQWSWDPIETPDGVSLGFRRGSERKESMSSRRWTSDQLEFLWPAADYIVRTHQDDAGRYMLLMAQPRTSD